MEKATLKVDSDVLNKFPRVAIAVRHVGSNSGTKDVFKPLKETRRTKNIRSIAVDSERETAEFLFSNGDTETTSIYIFEPWDDYKNVLHVFGSSDDLIEFRGANCEEYNAYPNAVFRVKDVVFVGELNNKGEWTFDVDQNTSSDVSISPIGSELSQALRDYSEVLTIRFDEELEEIKKLS